MVGGDDMWGLQVSDEGRGGPGRREQAAVRRTERHGAREPLTDSGFVFVLRQGLLLSRLALHSLCS